jgi:glucose-6-phosphate isomerase
VNTADGSAGDINAFDIRAYIGERTSMPSITGIVDAAIAGDCN